jgi:hypothetical protein
MFHGGSQPREFVLPSLNQRIAWRTFVDTRQTSPHDVFPAFDGPRPRDGRVSLDHHSLMVFVSSD